ncbi:MAG: CsbD family protein [Actinobacteria bacterium]|nr:CsbD family protein [Actinomycetota bacterium]
MADTPSNTDEAKGRVKEATGKLTGDKDLQNEGKLDQAEGKLKEGVDNLADKARNLLHKDKH